MKITVGMLFSRGPMCDQTQNWSKSQSDVSIIWWFKQMGCKARIFVMVK